MTAPAAAADRVSVVAAWDVERVSAAVARLADVCGHLLRWRARLEGVGRSLESGECWAGAAARSAVASVEELSMATWTVDAALHRSLDACHRVTSAAATAREWAGIALAEAARGDGEAARRPLAALRAIEHADAATAAAREAAAELPVLAAGDVTPLVPQGGPVAAAVVSQRGPGRIATWWAGLPLAVQEATIVSAPAVVGALDGVPAWARDRANRLLLRRALADPDASDHARAAARVVAVRMARRRQPGGRSSCTCSTWRATGSCWRSATWTPPTPSPSLVPGVGNTPGRRPRPRWSGTPADLGAAARAAAPGRDGRDGGLAGLPAAGHPRVRRPPVPPPSAGARPRRRPRRAGGRPAARPRRGRPRTTVVAHSYGTVVVDEAADEPGRAGRRRRRPAGQSRAWRTTRRAWRSPEVFDAASPGDPVSCVGWFGDRTVGGRLRRHRTAGRPPRWGTPTTSTRTSRRWPPSGEVVAGRAPGEPRWRAGVREHDGSAGVGRR